MGTAMLVLSAWTWGAGCDPGSVDLPDSETGSPVPEFEKEPEGVDTDPPPPPPPGPEMPRPGPPSDDTWKVVHTDKRHTLLAVTSAGLALAVDLNDPTHLLAANDGARTFRARGRHPQGAEFRHIKPLKGGVLLAEVAWGGAYHLARSTDGGQRWTDVLNLGAYRWLSPLSIVEAGDTLYFLEYQSFTRNAVPVRLWASEDGGARWTERFRFEGHRHGHGLVYDPDRRMLWAFFGDSGTQAGLLRSSDGGRRWAWVQRGYASNGIAGQVLPGGALLFGQDTLWQPDTPHLVRVTAGGLPEPLMRLPGPSYSLHRTRAGGFILGTAREPTGDIWAQGEDAAYLFVSEDGQHWREALRYPRLSATLPARADVYFELLSGEVIVQLQNVRGFGSSGTGFQVLRPPD